jgi:drug/metabolite transporter (DMT)-like permease
MCLLNYILLRITNGEFDVPNTYILGILILRVAFGFTNGIVHFYAFQVYRIGDVLCFFQLSSIFVGIFAYILWQEEFGKKEIFSVVACFVGCAFITKPPFLTGEESYYSNTDLIILFAIPLLEAVI